MVPIIVSSVKTGKYQRFMALVDSGADANLMPGAVTKILGCAVMDGNVGGGAKGIGDTVVSTWYHDLQIKLLSPDKLKTIWEGTL